MRSSLKLADCLIHRQNPLKSARNPLELFNVAAKRQFSQKALERFHGISASSPIGSIPNRVLITGGMGQLGRSFAQVLASVLGADRVLLSDICRKPADFDGFCAYRHLDILDRRALQQIVVDEEIDLVIHFSALLSALGEQNVELALQVNCQGVQNVLQVAKTHKCRIFIPSTIGVFGESTPRQQTPDVTIQRPSTIYGVSKVFAELLGEYFCLRFGTDFRSLRLPGIISTVQPGGGTTDYAIQMFWDALRDGRHVCYLLPDTELPMLFEEDCMAGLLGIIMAPADSLSLRTYNVAGFSCTPAQLADHIRQYLPKFQVKYEPCPVRQRIADSWPQSLDDSTARRDWSWRPEFNMERTVVEMLRRLGHSMEAEAGAEIPQLVKETRKIGAVENVGIFGGMFAGGQKQVATA